MVLVFVKVMAALPRAAPAVPAVLADLAQPATADR